MSRCCWSVLAAVIVAGAGCHVQIGVPKDGNAAAFSPATLKEVEKVPPQRIDVKGDPKVIVKNRVGQVRVSAGEEGVIVIEAEKHAATRAELATINLAVEHNEDTVTISWDTDETQVRNRSLELTITAPRGSTLQLNTDNGDVTIDGFSRAAQAHTGVGSITVNSVTGNLALRTGNGAITVEGAAGDVDADTGVGDIVVHGTKGARTARSGNGEINIDGAEGPVTAESQVGGISLRHAAGRAKLSSGNGSITVSETSGTVVAETSVGAIDVSANLSGESRMKTGSGEIVVALPASATLRVDATTGNGAIQNAFNFPVDGLVSRTSRGQIGDGTGGSLRLETGVGGIDIRKQ